MDAKLVEPRLLQTSASGELLPATLGPVLAKWTAPTAKLHGQTLRLATRLSLEDDACAGFTLDFMGQGVRIEGNAHGASAPLLVWALHEIGTQVHAEVSAEPVDRAAAMAYLEAYETDVETSRREQDEPDGDSLVAWLAREELIIVDGGSFAELPLGDPAKAYEQLVDDDAVEDLFISERDLARLITRFQARFKIS